MRLRSAAVAAFGAFTLLLAVPSSASAAMGEFQYTFVGLDGTPQQASLHDPASGECVNLPEVSDPSASEPAHSPRNRTTSTATVFTEPDCTGDEFSLRPVTGRGSERLKVRSVVFS
ncbi:hypothetical protein GCM10010347_19610 [Streptomyces cirratus]|uniref:Secreted protein n=1 Tax=Streptomyces cirratus TaxID=68187 RepID=A0ABQ3EPM0_9ACTN|nr:hypothetical protein [Streptomyces cirratus]GHB50174.1 hypothetical protein GCM10010347_19610 [Streptomyces cirratus]